MNPVILELALKKQRLQLRSAAQRAELAGHATALAPVLDAADHVVHGIRWLQRHPAVIVGATVAVIVARPRLALRWARRSFYAWQIARRLRTWIDDKSPA